MTCDADIIIVPTNEYQTPITREFLDSMPKDVSDEFMNIVTNIPFVKRMISPTRKRAKDLPRDAEGKIIIDVTEPHILEDMDYFRPAAKFYEENGCYTFLKPNKNKGSEYQKWFQEEKRRCLEGYVRESDGEWVTGYMYFYLNYAPIKLNRQSEKTGVWHQIQHLPDFWEGVYYGFHALQQARLSGKHLIELARRGASKSYRIASMMGHNLSLGEDSEFQTDVNSILTAYTKEYLSEKDGTLSKFEIMRSYLALNTEFKRAMLKAAPSEMVWRQGYKDSMGISHSTNNIVMGLSVKDDESKVRGKRGMIFFEEMGAFPNLKEVYMNVMDSVKDGDHVFSLIYLVGTAGDEESDFSGAKLLLYNPTSFGLLAFNNVWSYPSKSTDKFGFFFPAYISRSGCMDKDGNSDVTKAIRAILMSIDEVKQSGDMGAYLKRKAELCITPEDALLKVKANYFPVPEINERLRQLDSNPHVYDDVYVGTLVDTGKEVVFKATDDMPIRTWKVSNTTPGALEIFEMPVKGKDDKPMANRYLIGCLTEGQLVNTESGLKPVEQVGLYDKLLNKDGEYVAIRNLQRRIKRNEPVYSIKLYDTIYETELTGNHPVYAATPKKHYHNWSTHLKTGEPAVYYKYDFSFKRADELKVGDVVKTPIPYIKEKELPYQYWPCESKKGLKQFDNPLDKCKFWWLVGLVLGDGWCSEYVTSISFNSEETQYVARVKDTVKSVFKRSLMLAKDRGTYKEYSFTSKQFSQFFTTWFGRYASNKHIPEWVKYLPKKYKVALLLGYLDSDGCCCKNSMEFVSISKQLLVDIQDILLSIGIISGIKRLRKEGVHTIAGRKVITKDTYSLAVARAGVEKFAALVGKKDQKFKGFDFRATANHAIKRCWLSEDGAYVYYKISKINSRLYTGTVYNFECDTHTYMCHHLPTHNCDPVDNDRAESDSLFSVFVLDLATDRIVAEYTGRKDYAEQNYQLLLNMCKFYNARAMVEANKKGYYSFFARKNATWMLADCPEYLKARNIIKYSTFGSAQKGITVNAGVKALGLELINTWLQTTHPIDVRDESGEVHQEQQATLFTIRNRALLEEMASFTPGDNQNYDRLSALSQAMLYREEFVILYGGYGEDTSEDNPADDPFFEQEWQRYKERQKWRT